MPFLLKNGPNSNKVEKVILLFKMRSTLNFDKTTASYSGIFVQGLSISPRCDSIIKEVKVGNKFPPPQWLARISTLLY